MLSAGKKTSVWLVERMGEKANVCWVKMWVVKGIVYLTDLDLDGHYNIKIYLREIWQEIVELFHLAQYLGASEWLILKG